MAPFIIIAAYCILLAGYFMLVVAAFRIGALWGLGCLFLPFVSLFFLMMHWDVAKKPFGVQLLGGVLVMLCRVFLPDSFHRIH